MDSLPYDVQVIPNLIFVILSYNTSEFKQSLDVILKQTLVICSSNMSHLKVEFEFVQNLE